MVCWILEMKQRQCFSRLVLAGMACFLFVLFMEIFNDPSARLGSITSQIYSRFKGGSEYPLGQSATPRNPKIAICLVGGARKFELTGPSLLKNVLNLYPNSDVFLHSPLDKDAHKFSLLKDSKRLAMVRIFSPKLLNETEEQLRVLTASNSPNGIQGLLQYFSLVEGCLTMIKSYQKKHNVTYDWIVRTRVDGYWTGPLLSPDKFSKKKYIVPPGSQYGGLNDRLGIGNMETSEVALSRLSLIPLLNSTGYTWLNSETAFKRQLQVKKVDFKFQTFPFCVLSERKYVWPPTGWGVPVASIATKGPLNGAKCRPCKPASEGEGARNMVQSLVPSWSWTLPPPDLKLCNAHDSWEQNWENIFDKVAGSKVAATRKKIKNRTLSQCIKDLEAMRKTAVVWDSPSSEVICRKAYNELK